MSLHSTALATMPKLGPAIAGGRSEGAAATDKAAAAMRVGRQFEQMFLSQMLAPIFETIQTDGPFGGGHGERMMRSFQVDAYAKSVVARGGIGLAPRIADEIIRMQETSNG